jgi:general stress protein 26
MMVESASMGSTPFTCGALLEFMREHSLGIEASVSAEGAPQAALVGFVVTDEFELVFDTSASSRKVDNLRQDPRIAFVIGATTVGDERTVQYEGVADEPTGPELERLKELYFESFPDGLQRAVWPGITYIRARPTWIRYTDFNQDPPEAVEFDRVQLGLTA